ncbi:hypothetical protein DFH06DRAFT_1180044 [Mycena polygramma]|nr:hypothetical protein DFH06DRAFT_1180044 [Mycena polygramma]
MKASNKTRLAGGVAHNFAPVKDSRVSTLPGSSSPYHSSSSTSSSSPSTSLASHSSTDSPNSSSSMHRSSETTISVMFFAASTFPDACVNWTCLAGGVAHNFAPVKASRDSALPAFPFSASSTIDSPSTTSSNSGTIAITAETPAASAFSGARHESTRLAGGVARNFTPDEDTRSSVACSASFSSARVGA